MRLRQRFPRCLELVGQRTSGLLLLGKAPSRLLGIGPQRLLPGEEQVLGLHPRLGRSLLLAEGVDEERAGQRDAEIEREPELIGRSGHRQ